MKKASFALTALVAAVLLVTACASAPRIESLTPQQQALVPQVQILKGAASQAYDSLGPVNGVSCYRNAYAANNMSDEDALAGIKITTASRGGNAVINTVCERGGTDWANNCWASVKCTGEAVRLK